MIGIFLFMLALYFFIAMAPFFSRLLYPLPYKEIIVEHSHRYNLEPQLVAAVIRVESNFHSGAVSAKGARGLMQIMPETGAWAAAQVGMNDFAPEKLFDPLVNISLGTWYLQDLYRNFSGNTYAALAAYNGGRGHVKRWLEEGIWDGSRENLEDIPFAETRIFVLKVEKAYRRYHQLYNAEEL
ncbi:MAG: lytic transglycosylase domain-containing protein [Bacillota bacterium]